MPCSETLVDSRAGVRTFFALSPCWPLSIARQYCQGSTHVRLKNDARVGLFPGPDLDVFGPTIFVQYRTGTHGVRTSLVYLVKYSSRSSTTHYQEIRLLSHRCLAFFVQG